MRLKCDSMLSHVCGVCDASAAAGAKSYEQNGHKIQLPLSEISQNSVFFNGAIDLERTASDFLLPGLLLTDHSLCRLPIPRFCDRAIGQ